MNKAEPIVLRKVKKEEIKISEALGINSKDIWKMHRSITRNNIKRFEKRFQINTNKLTKLFPIKSSVKTYTYSEIIVKFFEIEELESVSLEDFVTFLKILEKFLCITKQTLDGFKIRFNA